MTGINEKQSKTQRWRSLSEKLSAHNNTLCSTETGFECTVTFRNIKLSSHHHVGRSGVVSCGVAVGLAMQRRASGSETGHLWGCLRGFLLVFNVEVLVGHSAAGLEADRPSPGGPWRDSRAAQSENSVLSGSSLRSFGFLGATCKSAERRPLRQCRWRVSTTTTGRKSRSASALAITGSRRSSQGSQDTFSADVTRDRGVPDMRTPTGRKHRENRQYLLENLGRH